MKVKATVVLAITLALTVGTFGALEARGQSLASAQAPSVPETAPFTLAQLDQMLAPIALYPDPLVAQILMAATYPLEVVEADRWLQDPQNAALSGIQLAAALETQPWDPSVKSLVPFPQILHMMDGNLDWIERLGDAFLADQTAVMDSVQRLRRQAEAAGKLDSTAQQVVTTSGPAITIEPANPETVYVPVYDPAYVYGAWAYPAFPPYYFPGYFDGVIVGGVGFGWVGVAIVGPLWGWNRCDWGRHRIDLDRDRFAGLNGNRPPGGTAWAHDPSHRLGVPYRDPGVRSRFAGSMGAPDARRSFRGYPADSEAHFRPPTGVGPVSDFERSTAPLTRMSPAEPRFPSTFESFGRGADVRSDADRGRASRMSMSAFGRGRSSSMPAFGGGRSSAPRSMPSGGGGRR
ncbi:DUF3300 domain-containing protein [Paraburkholderia sp. BCC1885]|uniref:DUF3300 domain-containing protein n=1 Tax=Paraburkholderia sp. BCC1885 TaxID=2562669 RepID=UPI001642786B|nr:DUF3300 domain-containing protein [Paraburkholderia sp. BCC1885]